MKALLSRLAPLNWNDTLSLILIIIIPLMWILNGKGTIAIAPEVSGALIVTWSMIVQYYFRRAPPKDGQGDG